MKTLKATFIFLLFIALLSCGEDNTITGTEYGTITGKVVTSEDFETIEDVKITLSPTNNTTFTDENGEFKFQEVPVNDYSVEALKKEFLTRFEPVSLASGATVNIVFELEISTALNNPPTQPELLSPEDGVTDVGTSVELSYKSTDPDDDSITYRILIANDQNNDIIEIKDLSQNDTLYTVDNLKYGYKYFWQIGASDGINEEVLSATRSFTVTPFPNNRFLFVRNQNNNNVIFSSNINNNEPVNLIQLTSDDTNSWRPRKNTINNLIAFLRTENNQTHIYTMKPDGSEVTKVTSTVPVNGFNLNEVEFAWSANGDRILFPNYDKLYSINKDGSGLQQIYQTTDGNYITEIDWSNNGGRIALKTNNSSGYNVKIFTIDINGNKIDTVLEGSSGAAGGINFSVAGDKLLYCHDISGYESSDYRQLNSHIFLFEFSTNITEDLSLAKKAGTNDLDPRFSPNEAEIIFTNTSNDGVSQKDILKSSIKDSGGTGTNPNTELFKNAFMPDWE